MYVIKQGSQFFHGYGTTMSQPLWAEDGPIVRVTVFRKRSDAQKEMDSLTRAFGYEGLRVESLSVPAQANG